MRAPDYASLDDALETLAPVWDRTEERQQQSRADGGRGAVCDGSSRSRDAVDRALPRADVAPARGRCSHPPRGLARSTRRTWSVRRLERVLRRRVAGGAVAGGARPLGRASGAGLLRRGDAWRDPRRSRGARPGGGRDAVPAARARRCLRQLGSDLSGAACARSCRERHDDAARGDHPRGRRSARSAKLCREHHGVARHAR